MSDSPVRAAVVSVGNELLSGQTVDTNAAWLARALATRGIVVVRRYTVGDIESDISEALGAACAVAELVVVSGGLGPTPDDRTKAAVAERLGLTLVPDDGVRRAV
ncbi:MAG: molybdopterin-binding protein, partial [Longimicrobiales bacterium]